MGEWENQIKRTTQHRRLWSESQKFNFIDALLEATNEEEVKAAYVREFSLPVKTRERHDLLVDGILFEFKYSVKFSDIEVAAKVISQAIYYINRLFKKGRISEISYFVVADKDEARLFRVSNFKLFYESHEYQWDDFRPSSPDPKLIKAIKESRIIDSNRVYKITSQDDFQIFSSLLYKTLSPKNAVLESVEKSYFSRNFLGLKFLIFIFGLLTILSSVIIVGTRYHLDYSRELPPNKTD